MPKNDKVKLQGTNQHYLKLNREFAVGDRICKRTSNTGLSLPNTPKLRNAKHGVVVTREQKGIRSKRSKTGMSYRWHCEVQWDGSERTEWVDEQRLIHEDELSKFNESY